MSLLAALVLAAASAASSRSASPHLGSQLAVRVLLTGTPGLVAVHREGDVPAFPSRHADLGVHFARPAAFLVDALGGLRTWPPGRHTGEARRLEIAATSSEVSVLLHVRPTCPWTCDATRAAPARLPSGSRQGPTGARGAGGPDARADHDARRRPPPPVSAAPTTAEPVAPPAAAAPVAQAARRPSRSRRPPSGLRPRSALPRSAPLPPRAEPVAPPARRRLRGARARGARGTESIAELYPRLFPTGAPPEQTAPVEVIEPGEETGVPVVPSRARRRRRALRGRGHLRREHAGCRRAIATSRCSPAWRRPHPWRGPLHDRLCAGLPRLRDLHDVNSSSTCWGGIDLPVGSRFTLRAQERFGAASSTPGWWTRRGVLLRPRPLPS